MNLSAVFITLPKNYGEVTAFYSSVFNLKGEFVDGWRNLIWLYLMEIVLNGGVNLIHLNFSSLSVIVLKYLIDVNVISNFMKKYEKFLDVEIKKIF